MTYVSELNAQFAKEAMACQSLDNDEILNVRWATEDPNPVSKVSEKRRLEEMGQEAIQSRMDLGIVDAMRAVRALEEGREMDMDEEQEQEEGGDGEPDPKRPRLALENGDPSADGEGISMPVTGPNPPSLLTADALEGLKYFSDIRKRLAGGATPPSKPSVPTPSNGLGLADYGSDDDN